jgi:multiple sugar transport system substrate-binding protein
MPCGRFTMAIDIHKSRSGAFPGLRRTFLMGAAMGAMLLGGFSSASAQKVTVWSGYPEMEPFYRQVAESMKAKFPGIQVSIEAIPLREHEKRVALALSSGGSGSLIIELPPSTANRYLSNELLPKAPANVAAFVSDPKTSIPSSRPVPASAGQSTACRCFVARAHCSTTPRCSRLRA